MATHGGHLVAPHPSGLPSSTAAPLSKESLDFQLREYEKIIQFRDAVVAGTHPRFKPPPHLLSNLTTASQGALSASTTTFPPQNHQTSNAQSFAANAQRPSVPGLGMSTASPRPAGSRSTEIDPIFLQKSDDLIKAELQLQRQRLERGLKDDLDQRRIIQKTTAQSEPLPDFDVHEVLLKAQALVKATTTSAPKVTATPAVANDTARSDSSNENSYYSSQLNSPDLSRVSSQDDRASVGGSVTAISSTQHAAGVDKGKGKATEGMGQAQTAPYSPYQPATHQQQGLAPTFPPVPPTSQFIPGFSNTGYAPSVSQLDNAATDRNTTTAGESTSLGERSGDVSRPGSGTRTDVDRSAGRSVPRPGPSQHEDFFFAHPPSPLANAQTSAPVAIPPFHVSPSAKARPQPQQTNAIPQGTNAQVAALRAEPAAIVSSPDSSPQGGKRSDKKKNNKKKSKRDKRAGPGAEDVPYIKSEPQSPVPVTAPQFARPQKRQKRQSDHEIMQSAPERQPSRQYGGEYAPTTASAYSGPGYYTPRPEGRIVSSSTYGFAPEYTSGHRVSASAQPYPAQYAPNDPYSAPAAPGPPPPGSIYEKEPSRVYRDAYEASRMSARPEPNRARSRSPMGPPAGPAMRIVVDASGRRYYEPPPPPVTYRQSVPPLTRTDEPEIIYEKSVRAESRRPEYAENGVLYRTEPSPYVGGRRIVTQPEYAVHDPHRVYREREYSSRPMPPPPPEHYVQVRAQEERRHVEEMPRGYVTRATTARPAEPVSRYEMPVEYERVQSMRPEYHIPYPAPPHGEVRREVAQPVPMAYSVRPAEPQLAPRREFSIQPADPYYAQPVRPGAEVTYIEHPRGVPHGVTYDDGRDEYR